MTKKKKKCAKPDCLNITTGLLCFKHSYEARKIHNNRKEYAAAWARQRKYGITQDEFDALWVVFKGKCGICNIDLKLPLPQKGQPLDVVALDHNHKTGNIRGLLCNACNKAIGLFKENIEVIQKAKEYLS